MCKERRGIMTLDVFNTFNDVLSERIDSIDIKGDWELPVGDCFEYALKLLNNNDSVSGSDQSKKARSIVEDTLRLIFLAKHIEGTFLWAPDNKKIVKS